MNVTMTHIEHMHMHVRIAHMEKKYTYLQTHALLWFRNECRECLA